MQRIIRALLSLALAFPLVGLAVAGTGAAAAQAEDNGVGLTPALGWSSWSFVRHDPTAAVIEAQAKAMKTSGLAAVGYQYVNVDDFWYDCPGSQGPDVDEYGRWVTDSAEFPPSATGENGIAVIAAHVHKLGLKFGLYVTSGISDQAVSENTPIEGTSYTADEIADGDTEANYNCGGMQGIDYAKAGIIVRNDMTASGTGVEGVILYESPSGGIQLEWDDNGGTSIDNVTPANGTIADTVPVYLRLVVGAGGTYTGYYSTDGSTWTEVGAVTVPDQNATQDAGLFMLSHAAGSDGLVDFSGFDITG